MIGAHRSHLQLRDVLTTMKSRFNVPSGSQQPAKKTQESSVQSAALAELEKYGAFEKENDLLPIVIAHSSTYKAKEPMQKEAELFTLVEETKAKILNEEPELDDSLALIKAIHQNEGVYQRVKDTVHEVALCKAFKGEASDVLAMTKVKGFDINKRGEDGETLLTRAAEVGRIDVVNALLELDGIDVNQTCTTKQDTPLIKAARQGHLNVVEALLKYEETNKDCVNQFKVTPLMVAAQGGHIEVVKALLNAGVDIEAIDDEQTSALMVAALNSQDKVVKVLIDAGANVKAKDDENNTALITASAGGCLDTVKELLKVADTGVNIQGNNSYTALHYASQYGQLDVVKELVNAGADCNIKDKQKKSPLAIAARKGYFDIVLELLKVDGIEIKINAENPQDSSLLLLAAQSGRVDVLEALVKKGVDVNEKSITGNTAISVAAEKRHLEFVKGLLKAGANPNANDIFGTTALHMATHNGHLEIVQELLKVEGIDVDAEGVEDNRALQIAARAGNKDILIELLKAGAKVNAQDMHGFTALHRAAQAGHLEVVQELLKIKDIAVDIGDSKEGFTALFLAAEYGYIDIAVALINAGANPNAQDKYGITALHRAARAGNKDTLIELLKAEANPHAQDDNGTTALHYASHSGHLDVVKELLNAEGVDANIKDKQKRSPLAIAARNGHFDIVLELLKVDGIEIKINAENPLDISLLLLATQSGRVDVLEALIEKGVDVNEISIVGSTAISVAVEKGHLEFVKGLLKAGANPNAKDVYGNTALHIATQEGNLEIVQELLKVEGIYVDVEGIEGSHALHLAARAGNKDILIELLKAGAQVNALDDNRTTALHRVALAGNMDILIELLKAGANPNAQDMYGTTALHRAVQAGHLEIVQELLKIKDIDMDLVDNEKGLTALFVAARYGYMDIAVALINAGANPNTSDKNRLTLLSLAVTSGNLKLVDELLKSKIIDPNKTDGQGNTPLIIAAKKGKAEAIRSLLNHPGIDINKVSGNEQSALKAAIAEGHENIVRLLCNQPSIDVNLLLGEPKQSFLLQALIANRVEIFKILLEHENINVNPPLVNNRTLLSIAVGVRRHKFVRELVKREDLRYEIKDPNYGYDALMFAVYAKDIEVIQELLKIDGINLNTVNAKGKSLFSLAAGKGDMTVLCTLISTGKIKFDSIEESDAYNEPVNKLIKDFRTSFEKIYKSKDIRNLSLEEYKDLIEKNKDNDFMLYIISKLNIKAAYIIARDHGERYLSILNNNLVDLQASQDADTMPEPDQDVDVSVLLKLVDSHGLPEEVKQGVENLVANIKERRAIPGLPSKLRDPENFEKAFAKIERELQVIVTALIELDTMIDDDPEKDSKDPKEKLISLLNRLGEIGPFCGTRYMQEMPLLYHGEVALMQELKCVQKWSEKALQIPESASKELAIRSHMGDVLYPLRIEALKGAYEETKPPGDEGNDVHYLSGFWKRIKEDFSLKDDVDTDPLAENFRLDFAKVKSAFKAALKAEPIIDTASQHITLAGGDNNPYLGFISELAGESRVGLPLEQVMEDVYEYDDFCVPTGIKKPFVGVMFQDLGLLH